LVNGDCLFDFEFDAFYRSHADDDALATLTACRVVSQYGLIVVRNDIVVSFSRDSIVRAFNIENGENGNLLGYVNAGITLLNRRALKEVNLLESTNLEADLFSRLIELEQVKLFFNRSVLVCCRNAKRPRYRKFRRKGRPPRRGHRFIARQLDAAASRAGSWPV